MYQTTQGTKTKDAEIVRYNNNLRARNPTTASATTKCSWGTPNGRMPRKTLLEASYACILKKIEARWMAISYSARRAKYVSCEFMAKYEIMVLACQVGSLHLTLTQKWIAVITIEPTVQRFPRESSWKWGVWVMINIQANTTGKHTSKSLFFRRRACSNVYHKSHSNLWL